MTILIAGFGSNDKVPGPVTSVTYGVGGSSLSAQTLKMLLVASKSSLGGSAVEDTEIFPVLRVDDAITKTGAGSEFARAAAIALRRKVQLFGICPSLSAATAATLSLIVAGTWSSAGSWEIRIDGEAIGAGITKTMTKVTLAAAMAAYINGKSTLPCTALQGSTPGVNDDTLTLTWKSPGVRGNQSILWVVSDNLPAGCTIAAVSTPASSGSITATGYPRAVTNGMTFLMQVDGSGGPTTKTVVAHQATLTLTGGSYAAAAGETITISRTISGATIITVLTLTGGDQDGYVADFNTLAGISAVKSSGNIILTVDQAGSGSAGSITAISGGAVTTKIGATAPSAFTLTAGSNVADDKHVTPSEMALILAIAGSTFSTTSTSITWTSSTTGLSSSVQFTSGTGVTAAGFDTSLHSGSAAVGGTTVTGGGVPFSGGAAVEDVSTALTTIGSAWYNYIAIATNDSTNLGRWRSWADGQAAPFVEKPSFLVLAMNGSLVTAASRAQNDLNDPFFQLAWMLHGESHPTSIAAALCALRCETEQVVPNSDYDGSVLLGIAPMSSQASADVPDRSTMQTALDEGVTPLTSDNDTKVVRSITTLSLNGTVPYYGTLDTYQAVVPQNVRARLKLRWAAHRAKNKYLRADPSPSEPTPPEGVTTPTRWNAEVTSELKDCERDLLITGVNSGTYVPRTEYDPVADRFMTEVPLKVLGHFHSTGISVLQISN